MHHEGDCQRQLCDYCSGFESSKCDTPGLQMLDGSCPGREGLHIVAAHASMAVGSFAPRIFAAGQQAEVPRVFARTVSALFRGTADQGMEGKSRLHAASICFLGLSVGCFENFEHFTF